MPHRTLQRSAGNRVQFVNGTMSAAQSRRNPARSLSEPDRESQCRLFSRLEILVDYLPFYNRNWARIGDSRSSGRTGARMSGTHRGPYFHPVILVVEDKELQRQTIQQILEEAEFLVLPAENARQAIELAQSCAGPINLLITMLHPAGMPGPDLALHLRKRSPEMSVLYCADNPLAALDIPDPAEVISSMLPMPFSRTRLLGRINTLLASHS